MAYQGYMAKTDDGKNFIIHVCPVSSDAMSCVDAEKIIHKKKFGKNYGITGPCVVEEGWLQPEPGE